MKTAFATMTTVAAAATPSLDAAIVDASAGQLPLSPPSTTGTTFWIVGDGSFRLVNTFYNSGYFGDLLGGGGHSVVGSASNLGALSPSNSVGPGLSFTSAILSITTSGFAFNATAGETNFGFRFPIGGESHYGWGKIDVGNDGENPGYNFTITEAYYCNVPDTPIHVGSVIGSACQIPEPSGLALLACGAAGVLARRKRRVG